MLVGVILICLLKKIRRKYTSFFLFSTIISESTRSRYHVVNTGTSSQGISHPYPTAEACILFITHRHRQHSGSDEIQPPSKQIARASFSCSVGHIHYPEQAPSPSYVRTTACTAADRVKDIRNRTAGFDIFCISDNRNRMMNLEPDMTL